MDHSSAGAQHAVTAIDVIGHLLAYVISGHHSGLLDGRSDLACLEARLKKKVEPYDHGLTEITSTTVPSLPPFVATALSENNRFSVGFFVRMLFSCVVDADFLDTEAFINSELSFSRPEWPCDVLSKMSKCLDDHIAKLDHEDTPVTREREEVRECCLNAAENPPGFFSLTVPTGGGKTLSSFAFALRHACLFGLKRIIYVVPFTSIIEQNADALRKAVGTIADEIEMDPVIEHHSNYDPNEENTTSRLATENWDAPIIITTSVQFYESLFANRTSRCRKLHNIAESVIILDEAQTIPVTTLKPCLSALSELVKHYGSTVVLCTATQPAIHLRKDFPIGLSGVREIISDPVSLYEHLRRVDVDYLGDKSDKDLAALMQEHKQALCIVNTRSHALNLYETLGDSEDHFHLSALMCPEHRSEVISAIKRRLKEKGLCRVVSTQLIEAGVDIDFPVVFRALAGLDSIAQAAGRCNRDGRLDQMGRTCVFNSEHVRSELFFSETTNCTTQILDMHDDLLSLEAIYHYFKLYYWSQSTRWDVQNILDGFHFSQSRKLPFLFDFHSVADKFRLIDETGRPVIIPWGENGKAQCEVLRSLPGIIPANLLRRLQRYTVQIPNYVWLSQVQKTIELVHKQYPVLISPEVHYRKKTGLHFEGADNSVLMI